MTANGVKEVAELAMQLFGGGLAADVVAEPGYMLMELLSNHHQGVQSALCN